MAIIAACVLSLRPILTYIRTGSATPTSDAERSFRRIRLTTSSGGSSGRKPWSKLWTSSRGSSDLKQWTRSDMTNTTTNTTTHAMTQEMVADKSIDALAIPMALPDDLENLTALPSIGPEARLGATFIHRL